MGSPTPDPPHPVVELLGWFDLGSADDPADTRAWYTMDALDTLEQVRDIIVKIRDDAVATMYRRQGATMRGVARDLGISTARVEQILRRNAGNPPRVSRKPSQG